jgi:mono/diheme cytochrome c family protein
MLRVALAVLLTVSGIAIAAPNAAPRGVSKIVGHPARGKVLFRVYCSNCHTLEAAGARGHLGPNLDKLKPSYAQVVTQLITGGTGGAGLPAADLTFGPGIHTFTASEMHDIAAFVFISTRT